MSWVVISHPQLDDARGTIHVDAIADYEARGWVVVGETISPLETRTVDEIEADEAAADAIAAEQLAERERAAFEASLNLEPSPDPDDAEDEDRAADETAEAEDDTDDLGSATP